MRVHHGIRSAGSCEVTSAASSDCTATLDLESDVTCAATWAVVVAHHHDPTRIGLRATVRSDAPVELGRDCGGGLDLDDEHLSRRHARFEVDRRGGLQLLDLGSRNGTFLNGVRIDMAGVRTGDVVGLGRRLLVVERAVRRGTPAGGHSHEGSTVGERCSRQSEAWIRCLDAADAVAARETPVLLWGPSGAGKDHLARRIHERSGVAGKFCVLRCGGFGEDAVAALGGPDGSQLLHGARGGTLYLDGIDDASQALQAALLELLEHGRLFTAGVGEAVSLPLRVIASSRSDPRGLACVRKDFVHRLARWVIVVPSLQSRPSDVAHLIDMFAQRYAGSGARVHPELAFRLLRHSWPGNVRELEAVMERAVAERSCGGVVAEFPELDQLLTRPCDPLETSATRGSTNVRARGAWTVAASGQWFVAPSGNKQRLDRRKVLVALLAALVRARREQPGVRLTVADLLAAAWPDDRFVGTAGANRVYVALATLRKLGLREVVVRNDGGYVLDPETSVRIVDG